MSNLEYFFDKKMQGFRQILSKKMRIQVSLTHE